MLEDEHPAYLWVYIYRALHVVRVECSRSAFELVGRRWLVEIEVEGVEGDLFAVWSHVGAVVVC